MIEQLLEEGWRWAVLRVDWFLNQPRNNLIAFIGVAVVFFFLNSLVRWGIRTWPTVVAPRNPRGEVLLPTLLIHLIVVPVVYGAGLVFFWAEPARFMLTKMLVVVPLTLFFSLINYFTVRGWQRGGFPRRFIWTLIGGIILFITYFTVVWVLLKVPGTAILPLPPAGGQ